MQSDTYQSEAPLAPRRSIGSVRRFARRYAGWIALIVIIALIIGAFVLGRYSVYRAHPELSGEEQATAVLLKVGKLMQLPQGENPSMAKVTDADQVRTAQPFLAQAQNGDILIIYAQAGTAILYRPSTDKLVAVGPVTPQTAAPSAPAAPAEAPATTTHATSTSKK